MAIPTILSGAAGRALATLRPLESVVADVATSRTLINSAKGDIAKALGTTRQPAFSAELHATSRNLASGMGGPQGIHAAIDELGVAASRTATRRIVLGSLAVGGGVAGLIALSRSAGGGDSVPMAPGPIGEHRAPADSGTLA